MTGYAHNTCDTKVYCPHVLSERCLCCLSEEDARQKFLDPALIFVKGARDNRIIHFIQPKVVLPVSEYRSNYKWPDTESQAIPYVPPKEYVRFESKKEYDKIFSKSLPKKQVTFKWNKGIADQIFEKQT